MTLDVVEMLPRGAMRGQNVARNCSEYPAGRLHTADCERIGSSTPSNTTGNRALVDNEPEDGFRGVSYNAT
jgi:hypothetical protein